MVRGSCMGYGRCSKHARWYIVHGAVFHSDLTNGCHCFHNRRATLPFPRPLNACHVSDDTPVLGDAVGNIGDRVGVGQPAVVRIRLERAVTTEGGRPHINRSARDISLRRGSAQRGIEGAGGVVGPRMGC